MSLPYLFQTRLETIPANVPYLFSNETKTRQWREKLGIASKPRIGIAWSGSVIHLNDANRSIRLDEFMPLLSDHIEWHSLQNEYRSYDRQALGEHPEICQHQDDLVDFSDTAALIQCLDLVICADTSIAHAAGALGKRVWILVPYVEDPRWMLERTDSPWYPTATLYRQSKPGNWGEVIQKARHDLCSMYRGHDDPRNRD